MTRLRPKRALCSFAITTGALFLQSCNRSTPLEPGEFTSIAPEVVLTIEYETPEFLVTAHRFAEGDRFRVVVQTRAGSLRHCLSDDRFEQLLAELESLRIRARVAETALRELEKSSTHHRLRYAARPPMEAYEEVLTPLPSGALMVRSETFGYELGLTTKTVERLGQACSSTHAAASAERTEPSMR